MSRIDELGTLKPVWRSPAVAHDRCACCSEVIWQQRALVVKDTKGQLHPIRPDCEVRHAFNSQASYIPDFTRVLVRHKGDKKTPTDQSTQLFPWQEESITATLLRTRALPSVGVETDPLSAMVELASLWEEKKPISELLWRQVGRIVDGCNGTLGRQHSLATPDLMVALALQQWLLASIDSQRMSAETTNKVKKIQEEQQERRKLTHGQFTYLKDLTRSTHIPSPLINGHYLHNAAPKKQYAY